MQSTKDAFFCQSHYSQKSILNLYVELLELKGRNIITIFIADIYARSLFLPKP